MNIPPKMIVAYLMVFCFMSTCVLSVPSLPVTVSIIGEVLTSEVISTSVSAVHVDVNLTLYYGDYNDVQLVISVCDESADSCVITEVYRSDVTLNNGTVVGASFFLGSHGVYHTTLGAFWNGSIIGQTDRYIVVNGTTDIHLESVSSIIAIYSSNGNLSNNTVSSGSSFGGDPDIDSPTTFTAQVYYKPVGGGSKIPFAHGYVTICAVYGFDGCLEIGNIILDKNGWGTMANPGSQYGQYFLIVSTWAPYIRLVISYDDGAILYTYDDCPIRNSVKGTQELDCTTSGPGGGEIGYLWSSMGSIMNYITVTLGFLPPRQVDLYYHGSVNGFNHNVNQIYLDPTYWSSNNMVAYLMSEWILYSLRGVTYYSNTIQGPCTNTDLLRAFVEGYSMAFSVKIVFDVWHTGKADFIWIPGDISQNIEFYDCGILSLNDNPGRIAAAIWDLVDLEGDCNEGNPFFGSGDYCDQSAIHAVYLFINIPNTLSQAGHAIDTMGIYRDAVISFLSTNHVLIAQIVYILKYNYDITGTVTLINTHFDCPYAGDGDYYIIVTNNGVYPCNIAESGGVAETDNIPDDILYYIVHITPQCSQGQNTFLYTSPRDVTFDRKHPQIAASGTVLLQIVYETGKFLIMYSTTNPFLTETQDGAMNVTDSMFVCDATEFGRYYFVGVNDTYSCDLTNSGAYYTTPLITDIISEVYSMNCNGTSNVFIMGSSSVTLSNAVLYLSSSNATSQNYISVMYYNNSTQQHLQLQGSLQVGSTVGPGHGSMSVNDSMFICRSTDSGEYHFIGNIASYPCSLTAENGYNITTIVTDTIMGIHNVYNGTTHDFYFQQGFNRTLLGSTVSLSTVSDYNSLNVLYYVNGVPEFVQLTGCS